MPEEKKTLRAVVVAMNGCVNFAGSVCSPMIPLVDRPFLQHVVECLVERGVKQIDFLLHRDSEHIERHFETGQRWGVSFEYHLVREEDHPYSRVAGLGLAEESFLLVKGDLLQPEGWTAVLSPETNQPDQPVVFATQPAKDSIVSWAGAAWVTPSMFAKLAWNTNALEFEKQLVGRDAQPDWLSFVADPLKATSFAELLKSQGRVLNREFPELLRFSGGNDDIWIGRNVYMQTIGGQFEAPIYIGQDCTVEGGTKLGPNVVILDGAFINSKCEIRDALILPQSLVGEGLAIDKCILDRHQLYNAQHDVSISVDDELLFSSADAGAPLKISPGQLISRAAALLALIILSPILLVLLVRQKLRHGQSLNPCTNVRLPLVDGKPMQTFQRYRFSTDEEARNSNWRHFWCEMLPGLINVARGELGWVGVAPLSPEELEQVPDELRSQYTQCKAGLANESTVMYGQGGTVDERLMAEVFYAVAVKSTFTRFQKLGAYLFSVLFGPKSLRNEFTFCKSRVAKVKA